MRVSYLTYKQAIAMGVLLALLMACTACPWSGPDNEVNKGIAVIEEALSKLETQSLDWQDVVRDTQTKLTNDINETIRNEISNTLQRALQAGSIQFACGVDFVKTRLKQDLRHLLAKLRGQSEPPREPVICDVVPKIIDMNLPADRRNNITINGYDLDSTPPITLKLVNADGTVDVSRSLDRQTHYSMTINLGDGENGVKFTNTSQNLSFGWGDKWDTDQHSIPVIRTTPPCEVKYEKFSPPDKSLEPTIVSGDREFDGNGPRVQLSVMPGYTPYEAMYIVNLYTDETNNGDTHASYVERVSFYHPPPGWKIIHMTDNEVSSVDFVARKAENGIPTEELRSPGVGLVKEMKFWGDFPGEDIGKTNALLQFKELTITIQRTSDCK